MKWVLNNAEIRCQHGGRVSLSASQGWVRVSGVRVLVARDPEGRGISGCQNRAELTGIIPCTQTLPVDQGYSEFIRIDGHRVCLDTLRGKTIGSPPGVHDYLVLNPGQHFVDGEA